MLNENQVIPGFYTSPPEADKSEAFICKTFKGAAIINYCKPLITQQMEVSGPPAG